MGKRSRKRAAGPLRPAEPSAASSSRPANASSGRQGRVNRFIERADERPKPPWHPVPLIELSVLGGIVLIVIGLINYGSSQGRLAGVFGMALASLAGLDTAVRDHFAGFRSHSALLAAVPAVLTALALALLEASIGYLFVVLVAAVYLGFLLAFRHMFRQRSGMAFKV